jgi:hypothetical protein
MWQTLKHFLYNIRVYISLKILLTYFYSTLFSVSIQNKKKQGKGRGNKNHNLKRIFYLLLNK